MSADRYVGAVEATDEILVELEQFTHRSDNLPPKFTGWGVKSVFPKFGRV